MQNYPMVHAGEEQRLKRHLGDLANAQLPGVRASLARLGFNIPPLPDSEAFAERQGIRTVLTDMHFPLRLEHFEHNLLAGRLTGWP